jgi:hypothetical protein
MNACTSPIAVTGIRSGFSANHSAIVVTVVRVSEGGQHNATVVRR